ncbi:hypothetical protein GCM10010327_40690 [Streptomyces nitrosporeus]|nr:hypothetical protein GCM10010327_40690 [Streptomyces nitrosporeus]
MGDLWDFSGTSGPVNRHEREGTERSFAQVSGHRTFIAAGHGARWSLPGHLTSGCSRSAPGVACPRRISGAGPPDKVWPARQGTTTTGPKPATVSEFPSPQRRFPVRVLNGGSYPLKVSSSRSQTSLMVG